MAMPISFIARIWCKEAGCQRPVNESRLRGSADGVGLPGGHVFSL